MELELGLEATLAWMEPAEARSSRGGPGDGAAFCRGTKMLGSGEAPAAVRHSVEVEGAGGGTKMVGNGEARAASRRSVEVEGGWQRQRGTQMQGRPQVAAQQYMERAGCALERCAAVQQRDWQIQKKD